MTSSAAPVRVEPVVTRAQLKRFIELPWAIYKDDPHWVPPLKRDVRAAFDPSKHPFHEHSEAQPYIAVRGGEVVGRICAIRNRVHEEVHEEPVGFFGWFECIDDHEVAQALFEAVRGWLGERGLESMRGPTSFSTNEITGLFVDGDEGPPLVMMAHNPAYYPALLESCSLQKVKDLYAWVMHDHTPSDHLIRAEKLIARRYAVTVRMIDMSRFDEELATVRRLYNAAWEKNWGFVPMTDAEIDHMAAELRPILEPKLALFVDNAAGETIGFALALPDFNQVLKRMNGKLLPFGIVKALFYKRRITSMRVLILGLMEEWRGKGIDALLYVALIRNGAAMGLASAEQSWILEDNDKMNGALERMGGRMYRRYRLYEASL